MPRGFAAEDAQRHEPSHEQPREAALPIVPCAMVESGVLGAACADATFYVVTDAGVLLCTVDVDTFELTQAPALTPAPGGFVTLVEIGAVQVTLTAEARKSLDDASQRPLPYPYWHQLNTASERMSAADMALMAPHLAARKPRF